jgi:hypothetical protein
MKNSLRIKLQRIISSAISLAVIFLIAGCGGGGGGGGSDSFAGVYDVAMTKVIDDCRLGLDNTASFVHTVNQDGDRIVLNSGSITMDGNVNEEKDGFTVSTATADADGCVTGYGVSYAPSSGDQDYNVGLALVLSCGSLECTVGYSGGAYRR